MARIREMVRTPPAGLLRCGAHGEYVQKELQSAFHSFLKGFERLNTICELPVREEVEARPVGQPIRVTIR